MSRELVAGFLQFKSSFSNYCFLKTGRKKVCLEEQM